MTILMAFLLWAAPARAVQPWFDPELGPQFGPRFQRAAERATVSPPAPPPVAAASWLGLDEAPEPPETVAPPAPRATREVRLGWYGERQDQEASLRRLLLSGRDTASRVHAAQALGRLASASQDARSALLGVAADSDEKDVDVRAAAALSLDPASADPSVRAALRELAYGGGVPAEVSEAAKAALDDR